MKSKTNRRSKRVKKTRRNRRSRRTQRGGGKFGDSIKLRESGLQECRRKCDRDNPDPDPISIYNERNPTQSGWYITITGQWGQGPSYEIKNKSLAIEISRRAKDYSLYEQYLDMLEELPDPTKIYTTTGIFGSNKKEWKLIYNAETQLLEWENQKDKTKQPFVIQSPLQIGDKTATKST